MPGSSQGAWKEREKIQNGFLLFLTDAWVEGEKGAFRYVMQHGVPTVFKNGVRYPLWCGTTLLVTGSFHFSFLFLFFFFYSSLNALH